MGVEDMSEVGACEDRKAEEKDCMKAETCDCSNAKSAAEGRDAESLAEGAEVVDDDSNIKDTAAGLKAAWQKVTAEDVMSFVSDGLGLYFAVLVGMRLHSFWCGAGVYVLMAVKKVMIASWTGDGEQHRGKIGFEEMCVDEKLAERCMKHSAWLDGLVTLGLIVVLKLGWLELLFAE